MAKPPGKEDPSIDKQAVKALVTVYGPRAAARMAGLPPGTVLRWAQKFKWKKALVHSLPKATSPASNKDAGDMLRESLENSRINSTLHLSEYVEKASKKAAEHRDPLEVARKVRDVAGVFQVLYPPEEGEQLIEGSILIGAAKVTDNIQEIEASVVREELSNGRPAGD